MQNAPTPTERADNYRELQKLSRANRFLLMFGRPLIRETDPTTIEPRNGKLVER